MTWIHATPLAMLLKYPPDKYNYVDRNIMEMIEKWRAPALTTSESSQLVRLINKFFSEHELLDLFDWMPEATFAEACDLSPEINNFYQNLTELNPVIAINNVQLPQKKYRHKTLLLRSLIN